MNSALVAPTRKLSHQILKPVPNKATNSLPDSDQAVAEVRNQSETWQSLASDLHATQNITNPLAVSQISANHMQQIFMGR